MQIIMKFLIVVMLEIKQLSMYLNLDYVKLVIIR